MSKGFKPLLIADVGNLPETAKITVVYNYNGGSPVMFGAVRRQYVSPRFVFAENRKSQLTRVKIPKIEFNLYMQSITPAQAEKLHLFHILVLSSF